LRHNGTARYTVAIVALVVLLSSLAFSKRSTGSMSDPPSGEPEAAVTA
jgi:hypothetical protein